MTTITQFGKKVDTRSYKIDKRTIWGRRKRLAYFHSGETAKKTSVGRSRKTGTHHSNTAYLKICAERKNEVQVKSGTVQ